MSDRIVAPVRSVTTDSDSQVREVMRMSDRLILRPWAIAGYQMTEGKMKMTEAHCTRSRLRASFPTASATIYCRC